MGAPIWAFVGLVAVLLAWNGWRYYVRAVHGIDQKRLTETLARMDAIELEHAAAIKRDAKSADRLERCERTLSAVASPRPAPSFGAQRLQRG